MKAMPVEGKSDEAEKSIRYAVVGDSYSIGEGASRERILASVAGPPSRGERAPGGTRLKSIAHRMDDADAIERELPFFRAAQPDFATLMIGVNDWVQGVEPVGLSSAIDAPDG